jgi:hypothetical protein
VVEVALHAVWRSSTRDRAHAFVGARAGVQSKVLLSAFGSITLDVMDRQSPRLLAQDLIAWPSPPPAGGNPPRAYGNAGRRVIKNARDPDARTFSVALQER